MIMKIGDYVRFINSTGSGIVKGFLSDGRVIINEDGMDLPYLTSELVEIGHNAIATANEMVYSHIDKNDHNTPKKSRSEKEVVEIDLHAEKLPPYILADHTINICKCQVQYFLDVLKENAGIHGKRIVFIHGKGAGILRDELIHELNKRRDKFIYNVANYLHYDFHSAIEVIVA